MTVIADVISVQASDDFSIQCQNPGRIVSSDSDIHGIMFSNTFSGLGIPWPRFMSVWVALWVLSFSYLYVLHVKLPKFQGFLPYVLRKENFSPSPNIPSQKLHQSYLRIFQMDYINRCTASRKLYPRTQHSLLCSIILLSLSVLMERIKDIKDMNTLAHKALFYIC